MKTFVLVGVLASVVAGGCTQRRSSPIDETQPVSEIQDHILTLENEWAQVDVTNDRTIFEQIIAPDFHSTSSRSGRRRDRAEWLANWEYEGVTSSTHKNPEVQVFSSTLAVYTGINETKGLAPDGSEWVHQDICTDTWLKRNGRWQCIAAHCSRIK